MLGLHLSDDQIALAFCCGASILSFAVMYFSHHVGVMNRRVHLHELSRMQQLEFLKTRAATRSARDRAA